MFSCTEWVGITNKHNHTMKEIEKSLTWAWLFPWSVQHQVGCGSSSAPSPARPHRRSECSPCGRHTTAPGRSRWLWRDWAGEGGCRSQSPPSGAPSARPWWRLCEISRQGRRRCSRPSDPGCTRHQSPSVAPESAPASPWPPAIRASGTGTSGGWRGCHPWFACTR